jgi:hypothetical protein
MPSTRSFVSRFLPFGRQCEQISEVMAVFVRTTGWGLARAVTNDRLASN